MHLELWTNSFCNLANGKESGSEMKSKINPFCTNTFINLDKYICKFWQIYLTIWTNQIQHVGWTNAFGTLDKFILQFR